MLKLLVLISCLMTTYNPAAGQAISQTTSQTSSAITTSSTTPSTSTTPTTTAPAMQHGPVGQPAPTTGTPGGPTPYTYSTVVNGVTTAISAIFTPTSPATIPVTPSAVGTILDYSSWLAIYGPTHTPSAGTGFALRPISFPLILVVLLGILGGGGLLYV